MLRFSFFSTFIFFFILGCNSQQAELRRIETNASPMMLQLGLESSQAPGTFEDQDRCFGIAYDEKSESTYCAGYTKSYVSEPQAKVGERDALIIKFDRKFRRVWTKQFGKFSRLSSFLLNETFLDIQVGPSGSVYVSALMNERNFIIKLNSAGDVSWQSETFGRCRRLRIADGIYCAGWSGSHPTTDAYLSKWDFSGKKIWEKTLSASEFPVSDSSLNDFCNGLTVSKSGAVVCVGSTLSQLTSAYVPATDKHDGFLWILSASSGTTLDVIQIGTQLYPEELSTAEFDEEGNLIVAGNFQGSNKDPLLTADDDFFPSQKNTTTRHTFFLKYVTSGSSFVRAPSSFNTNITGSTTPSRLLNLGRERMAACLHTYGDLYESRAENGTQDIAISILDPKTMTLKRGIQFGATTKGAVNNLGSQHCFGLAKDVFGNVLIAGSTEGSTQETLAGVEDIMIWRLGPNLEF